MSYAKRFLKSISETRAFFAIVGVFVISVVAIWLAPLVLLLILFGMGGGIAWFVLDEQKSYIGALVLWVVAVYLLPLSMGIGVLLVSGYCLTNRAIPKLRKIFRRSSAG